MSETCSPQKDKFSSHECKCARLSEWFLFFRKHFVNISHLIHVSKTEVIVLLEIDSVVSMESSSI